MPRLLPIALLLTLYGGTLRAQETDTERAAARDVVHTLDSLEQSLHIPAMVARLTGPDAARDAVTARAKELMDTELLPMADDITRHPEIGFTEHRSVKILTDWLTAHGFDVTVGVAGLAHRLRGTLPARTTALPTSASSSSTTPCAAPRAPSTATSTARRGPSGSRPRSR